MFKLKSMTALTFVLAGVLTSAIPTIGAAAYIKTHPTRPIEITSVKNTEAGDINFNLLRALDSKQHVYQKIVDFNESNQTITFSNGSEWKVSNFDGVKGWDKHSQLVISQNHATFSTYKYALINMELGLAVPVSLVKSPIPDSKHALFVKSVNRAANVIGLSHDHLFIVHGDDNGPLKSFHENNLVFIGANTSDKDCQYPYIIIDASLNSHEYVRANIAVTR